MKHANLSIFVPHAGCPNRCSFCNQRSISGAQSAPDGAAVAALCAAQAERMGRFSAAEIAFFGGSFTAIPRAYMCELLEAAAPFVAQGAFGGIRISTRPDCIDGEILALLHRYHVTAIELGAQSMDDGVLAANRRGHTARAVETAACLIREAGFELGLQMMTGLYRSGSEQELETARKLAALHPDTVRIYPTVVMEETRLAELYAAGEYQPQTLEEAVALCARLLDFFAKRGIPVIRMGLHAQDSLEAGRVAGPWHPAFRELCEGRLLGERVQKLLVGRARGAYLVKISPRSVSKLTGHGARVLDGLAELGYTVKIQQDGSLAGLDVLIEEV